MLQINAGNVNNAKGHFILYGGLVKKILVRNAFNYADFKY